MKGRLSKPIAGKQLIGFGGADDIGRETTGASFAARPGDAVTAPADGRVLYSGPFRSYGQLLILDAGDGYHVVLAGMERIDVETGQFVSAGEPVAVMGARRLASVAVAEFGATHPALYVEFRKDGKPVDPSAWWMDEPSGRTTNDS
nr:peptidoglycan DD-metalloendopeptidase family protein [Aurantimonas marina]